MIDLLNNPLWKPEDLGRAIPDSPHAVSVCLPMWADNVAYEEHDPRVHSVLTAGYPRFVYNPLCQKLFAHCEQRFAQPGEKCLVFSSARSAERCAQYLAEYSGIDARRDAFGVRDLTVITFPETLAKLAKTYWQHFGEGVTSRAAARLLAAHASPESIPEIDEAAGRTAQQIIRERIAKTATASSEHAVGADDVLLYSCGMNAIGAVHRAITRLLTGRKTVQFGFPYVDSLKVQEKWKSGCHFFPRGDSTELAQLAVLLDSEPVGAIYTETPSNPLLNSPDIQRLSELARQHGIPLVIDNTIASINNDLLPWSDVLCTSLTKHFSGAGDVTGGSAIVNPQSPFAAKLTESLRADWDDALWPGDAVTLEQNSRDFEARVRQMNAAAEAVADCLHLAPEVETVYYPKYQTPELYNATRRSDGGYGSLMSVVLRDREMAIPFFDALRVSKGPNLGTNFTLACPFTILAHYDELDFVESCGVSRHLIRISVGLESSDDLVDRFQQALKAATAS
jgi:cystathionine gamma-synthase